MSTDIQKAQAQQTENPALANIMEMPVSWKTIHLIADTKIVPKQYRGEPEAMLAAALMGREAGLGPMESWQRIDLIDGQPSWSAEYLLDRIRSAGHEIYPSEISDERVELKCQRRRPDGSYGPPQYIEWTIEEARRVVVQWEGQWKTSQRGKRYFEYARDANGEQIPKSFLADKDNWRNYPKDMLFWRATTRAARWIFSDCLYGLKYLPEEINPDIPMDVSANITADEAIAKMQEDPVEEYDDPIDPEDVVDAEIIEDDEDSMSEEASPDEDPDVEEAELVDEGANTQVETEGGSALDVAADGDAGQPSSTDEATMAEHDAEVAGEPDVREVVEQLNAELLMDTETADQFDLGEIAQFTKDHARDKAKALAMLDPEWAQEGTVGVLQGRVQHMIALLVQAEMIKPMTVQESIESLHARGKLSTSEDEKFAEKAPTPAKLRKADWELITRTWWRFARKQFGLEHGE